MSLLQSASPTRVIDYKIEEKLTAMPVHGKFRRGANLVVLRSARMPSILFEAGYISNAEDAERIGSEAGRKAIVVGGGIARRARGRR